MVLGIADRAIGRDAQPSDTHAVPQFSFTHAGQPAPMTVLRGQKGTLSLADFRGKVLILNLWATWCPPCVKELPALDGLAQALGPQGVVVLAVSQDAGGWPRITPWWRRARLNHLVPAVDPNLRLSFGLRLNSLPVTLIYDRQGREVARLVGAAHWNSAEMRAFVSKIAKRRTYS